MNDYFNTIIDFGATDEKTKNVEYKTVFNCRYLVADFIGTRDDNMVFISIGFEATQFVVLRLDVRAGDTILIDEMSFASNVALFFS